ncbi:MAG: carbon starvation protein A [Deltaproteobacteria bacterium]|nr:MAG: carbon starvation protein A [Deltaproteobacteria bacterium]
MGTLLIALGAMILYLVAYNTYGRWLSRKIFKLDPNATVPSEELRDDKDYVPTDKSVVFGHHFTSIAGTGPIVGPAIAVMWGWVPALIWVLLGSIFIGAVHDFGSLIISMRNRGQTIGELAGRILTPRVRLLFLFILFVTLTIVLAIFGLVIAAVFKKYPSSITPCLLQIPIAIGIGALIHRQGKNLLVPSLIALALMYLTVFFGNWGPLASFNSMLASWPVMTWVVVLLVYSYIASVLPVWSLLQPRDYINSLQLLTALGLVILGLLVAGLIGGAPTTPNGARQTLEIVAPAFQWSPKGAPAIFPFLFITIACGAMSGFHCLVSSGTSSKQLRKETDAQFVGYGSMLIEGFLATVVILACVAGLGLGITGKTGTLSGQEAWLARYSSWGAASGLGAKVGAFVDGSANFLHTIGIPISAAIALMGVLVASFAGTTLDTACRLQRYVIQELASTLVGRSHLNSKPTGNPLTWLQNKHGATIFAIVVAGIMAGLPIKGQAWSWASTGKGGLILWPMFGATNQLLGGLAFLVIFFWLARRKLPIWLAFLPMLFMLVMPAWALILQLSTWFKAASPPYVLIGVTIMTLLLEVWMVTEAVLLWPKAQGVIEETLPPLHSPAT